MDKQEKIRRFIPCSLYCTDKIEAWLEEMAAEGYILYKFSRLDYAVFTKEAPQKIKYRLCIKGKNKDEEEINNLMRKYGWERADDIKNLLVFSSQNPQPFEADDESRLTELRDKAIKHYTNQNILSFVTPLLMIVLYVVLKSWAISAVNFGLGALLFPLSMITFLTAKQIIESIDIRTYKKHINDKNTYIINQSKVNLVLYLTKYISVAILFLSLILTIALPNANSDVWYTDSDNKENPPFAIVEDFVTGNAIKKSDPETDPGAMYNKWSNSVSKLNYYWRESCDYLHTDGTTESISLNVDYHDTFSPVLAKWLIWDYYFEDKSIKITSDVKKISGYDIDYGLTYHNWGYLVVIAQKGDKLIKADFSSVRTAEGEPIEITVSITDEEAIDIICRNFQ